MIRQKFLGKKVIKESGWWTREVEKAWRELLGIAIDRVLETGRAESVVLEWEKERKPRPPFESFRAAVSVTWQNVEGSVVLDDLYRAFPSTPSYSFPKDLSAWDFELDGLESCEVVVFELGPYGFGVRRTKRVYQMPESCPEVLRGAS